MIAYVGAWLASGLNWSCNEIFGHEFAEPIPEGYCDTKIAPNCPQGQQCDLAQNRCVVLDSGVANDVGKESETVPSIPCVDHAQCPFEQPLCLQNRCQNCMNDGICKSRFAGHEETCFEGKCVECSDSTICKTRYAGTKEVCANGACVECATNAECKDASKPVCDKNACRVAQRNFECPDSALELDGNGNPTGKCVAETDIVYVDNNDTNPMVSCASRKGTKISPACTVQQAYVFYENGGKKMILVKPSKGTSYKDSSPININQSIRIVGARTSAVGAPPVVIGDNVNVTPAATDIKVSLEDLQFLKVQAPMTFSAAIGCQRANPAMDKAIQLKLLYSWVQESSKSAVDSSACSVDIIASTFVKNGMPAISLNGNEVKLLHNMIVNNGTDTNNVGGVELKNVTTNSLIMFNTLVDNQGSKDGYTLSCATSGATPPMPPTAEYNIFLGLATNTKKVVDGCTIKNSVVPAALVGTDVGNISDGPAFIDRNNTDLTKRNLHLKPGDAANDKLLKARPTPGSSLFDFDIDDERRTDRQDGKTYIGADHIPVQ